MSLRTGRKREKVPATQVTFEQYTRESSFPWKWTFLHTAVAVGKIDIVEYLLKDCKMDPNVVDHGLQFTPLHYAAMAGSGPMYQLLKHYGARENVRGALHATPVEYIHSCMSHLTPHIDSLVW